MTTVDSGPVRPGAHLPEHPDFLWRNPEPKRSYDVIIVGAGGHGLAAAHYLAKNHGITNVAVLERGWLAGGNMARNTTIIRSNYLWDESSAMFEHSLKLWESLEQELDYPILFSQRGVMNLAHSLQDVRDSVRRVEANKLNGIDAEWLTPDEVKKICPIVNTSQDLRYPVLGATYQPRAGIAKHDYVAWGYARRADQAGVDIIQDCAVTGFVIDGDRVTFLGSVGPLRRAEILGGSAALLHPIAFDEPFGLSAVESMACGTPVVAFRRGSMPEVVDEGVTGFLVDGVEQAAAAVARLAEIDRAGCRTRAEKRFGAARMVVDYLRVYRELIGSNSRRSSEDPA